MKQWFVRSVVWGCLISLASPVEAMRKSHGSDPERHKDYRNSARLNAKIVRQNQRQQQKHEVEETIKFLTQQGGFDPEMQQRRPLGDNEEFDLEFLGPIGNTPALETGQGAPHKKKGIRWSAKNLAIGTACVAASLAGQGNLALLALYFFCPKLFRNIPETVLEKALNGTSPMPEAPPPFSQVTHSGTLFVSTDGTTAETLSGAEASSTFAPTLQNTTAAPADCYTWVGVDRPCEQNNTKRCFPEICVNAAGDVYEGRAHFVIPSSGGNITCSPDLQSWAEFCEEVTYGPGEPTQQIGVRSISCHFALESSQPVCYETAHRPGQPTQKVIHPSGKIPFLRITCTDMRKQVFCSKPAESQCMQRSQLIGGKLIQDETPILDQSLAYIYQTHHYTKTKTPCSLETSCGIAGPEATCWKVTYPDQEPKQQFVEVWDRDDMFKLVYQLDNGIPVSDQRFLAASIEKLDKFLVGVVGEEARPRILPITVQGQENPGTGTLAAAGGIIIEGADRLLYQIEQNGNYRHYGVIWINKDLFGGGLTASILYHELLHLVLFSKGIPAYDQHLRNETESIFFEGPEVMRLYGEPLPMPDASHFPHNPINSQNKTFSGCPMEPYETEETDCMAGPLVRAALIDGGFILAPGG